MSEHDFLKKVEEWYKKIEALYSQAEQIYSNIKKVIISVAAIIVTFGGVLIVQGFITARESAALTSKFQQLSETQMIMKELSDIRERDYNDKINGVKENVKSTKEELQRQLDLLMKDRKLTYRGANPNTSKTNTQPQPSWKP
jgi:hypothetical protein